jgi:hypothetical protein
MLVRVNGGKWETAEPASFAAETEFQALVEETFDQVLATQSDAPAVVAREVSMPGGGKIDILAVDADGVITVCECKLQGNAGIRREVVGQVLEYAGGLDRMSLRSFHARVEARLGEPLNDAMAARAGDEWDQAIWSDQVEKALDAGNFRVIIAVDKIGSTLKQTVLYLNSHTDLAVIAVELQRERVGEVEVLVPTVFADEQARQKVPPATLSSTAEVADADTLVVAATHAWPEYELTGAYICQPLRSFRTNAEYFGFYAKRQIYPVFPKIIAFRKNILFTRETVTALRATGSVEDALVADVVERDLDQPTAPYNREGIAHQVVLLDPSAGFTLDHPVRHEGRAAWLRGQRYTSSTALKAHPPTTEELRAGGG